MVGERGGAGRRDRQLTGPSRQLTGSVAWRAVGPAAHASRGSVSGDEYSAAAGAAKF